MPQQRVRMLGASVCFFRFTLSFERSVYVLTLLFSCFMSLSPPVRVSRFHVADAPTHGRRHVGAYERLDRTYVRTRTMSEHITEQRSEHMPIYARTQSLNVDARIRIRIHAGANAGRNLPVLASKSPLRVGISKSSNLVSHLCVFLQNSSEATCNQT